MKSASEYQIEQILDEYTDTILMSFVFLSIVFVVFASLLVSSETAENRYARNFFPGNQGEAVASYEETDEEDMAIGSEEDEESADDSQAEEADKTGAPLGIPAHISSSSIDLDINIVHPTSRDIDALNRALLNGVVYYPGSGRAGEEGNVLLFGHSSHLPIVYNKNYKAFNNISDLTVGDVITLTDSEYEYVYRVTRVYEAKNHEVEIFFDQSGSKLTLVTCNNFGAKEDRYIVEADFVSKKPL